MLMSAVAIGIVFRYILDPNFGLLNLVSQWIGQGKIDLLGKPATALLTVIIVICWEYTPFYMVLFLSALTMVSPDIRDSAKIAGANTFGYYWHIAVPMLKENILTCLTLSAIGSLKYFDLIYVLTNGGPSGSTEVMATYMYKETFRSWKMGYGSTIAIAMFIIVSLVSVLIKYLPKALEKRRAR